MHYSIMTIAWTILGFVDPVVVYLDATSQNIGRIKGNRSFLNMSAVEWGCATALLGLPPLVLYLYVREKPRVETAKKPTLPKTARRLSVVVILVSIRFWVICLMANYRTELGIP